MQLDKQDFYWNWALTWAINNLYYDLINVDVVHVPYSASHRNTSFFLKTRLWYIIADSWLEKAWEWWHITDVRMVYDETCSKNEAAVYVMGRNANEKAIFYSRIRCKDENNAETCECVGYDKRGQWISWFNEIWRGVERWCWNWKFFSTNYARWWAWGKLEPNQVKEEVPWSSVSPYDLDTPGIQFNKVEWWSSRGYFTDEDIESWYSRFIFNWIQPDWSLVENGIDVWDYILVYFSRNHDKDWYAAQVRMITWIDRATWRLMVDSPWEWMSMLNYDEDWWWEVWRWLSYYIIKWMSVDDEWDRRDGRWEVVWFSNNRSLFLLPNPWYQEIEIYHSNADTRIIWVAEATEKIFIMTDNGFIHYNSTSGGYNKFFIQEDMYAWVDKWAIASFRDIILALWRNHIAVWVPDEQNKIWTMYDQSQTIWLWWRESYAEYDWTFVFVSNDKRLLTLEVANNVWKYMLQHHDMWSEMEWWRIINSKLSWLLETDEVFIGNWWNQLKVFVQTKSYPFVRWKFDDIITEWWRNLQWWNAMTHVYKFDTLFRVWTEDHVPFLLSGFKENIYYWQAWLYVRRRAENKFWTNREYAGCDVTGHEVEWGPVTLKYPYETTISAFMIENENNWLDWHPLLFSLAKLNRLITTLGPWIYTTASKTRITAYSKWIWYTYEFPLNTDTEDKVSWIWLISEYYLNWWERLNEEEEEKLKCMKDSIQDSQHEYVQKCPEWEVYYHSEVQTKPWCDNYKELITESHWVCINDKLYELAPTMPLTTNLWENQHYSTQIKLELIWWQWDIITFGWWLAELFVAPLFTWWPDWEYLLQPQTDCK